MGKGLSLYLDLLRFGMASLVLVGHSTLRPYTGRPFALWFTAPYGRTAVMSFFVLSGFVIAHVACTTEKDPARYALARISRLYSVVIPALVLTFLCDTIGSSLDPALYRLESFDLNDHQLGRYAASFFLVQDFQASPFGIPGTNGPFWSLSYEFAYYIVLGLFLLRKWMILTVGTVAVFLLAGARILELFPLWLLGVGVYHLQRQRVLPLAAAALLAMASVLLLARVGWIRADAAGEAGLFLDYAGGFLVGVNLLAASALSGWLVLLLGWWAPVIRWLGGLTFAMYLCHLPLLHFLTAIRIAEPGTMPQHLWLFGGTFLVVAIAAYLSDHLRRRLRRDLHALAGRVPALAAMAPRRA
jgi:peptidoglycan/LPS O-acetylase OafA/YrhL